jgi:dolichol kinase
MTNSIAIAFNRTQQSKLTSENFGGAILERDRSTPHLARKFYHMAMGVMCFCLYGFVFTKGQALLTLAIVGGTFIFFDVLRIRWEWLNRQALFVCGSVMRREELKSLSANTFYIVGMTLIVAIFPKPIALLGILYLAVGDPVAAIAGTYWGRHKIAGTKKSIEGAAANWTVAGLVTFLVGVAYFQLGWEKALWLAGLGGTVSMLAELCPLPFDDNFTIPVLSASLLAAVSMILPLF